MNLPDDKMMLLSVINTKLRNSYENLDELCDDMNVDKQVILEKLRAIDYEYNEKLNKFV